MQGEALQCRLCTNVLILNAVNLQQHLQSKRHKKALQKLPGPAELLDQICLAGDISDPEEVRMGVSSPYTIHRLQQDNRATNR